MLLFKKFYHKRFTKLPTKTVATALLCASVVVPLAHTQAHAEVGDYSGWDSFTNRFKPRKADKPITAADQAKVPFTINTPSSSHNDGFTPWLYDVWQTVTLDPSTGAKCGDGSPYKFLVNRKASTSNIMATMEGGGACWDYKTCKNSLVSGLIKNTFKPDDEKDRLALLGATTLKYNPLLSGALRAGGSVFTSSFNPHFSNKTLKWTKIYLPYCTGDVFIGAGTKVYTDPEGKGEPLVVHHNGSVNMLQVAAWVRNNLEAPQQLMVNGFSAGGVGTTGMYYPMRSLFDVQKGYMINDAGPSWYADQRGSLADYPSKGLHIEGLKAWRTSVPQMLSDGRDDRSVMQWLAARLPWFDTKNLGTINEAAARALPNDKFGFTTFQEDYMFSSYSYRRFHPEAAVSDNEQRRANTLRLWQKDLNRFAQTMQEPNFGYYFPATRKFVHGHVVSGKPDQTADIQELGLTFNDFVNSITDSEQPIKAQEKDFEADRKQTDIMGSIISWVLTLGGL